MKAAFKQPGFALLFGGVLAGMVGDSLMLIVLAIWVKELTGSNSAAGLTFFCLVAPSLIAPVFGILVDRLKRRTLLIWGNLVSAVAVLPLVLVHDKEDVWIIYLVAVLYGISFVVLPAGLNGLLKELLPDEMLVEANAAVSTTKEALRLVGPLAGAGLFTVIGGGGVALIDAASFVLAAGAVLLLKLREDQPVREEGHWATEFMAGIHHIRLDPILKHTLVATGISLLVIGFMESAVFAMTDAFDRPASFVGVIISVQGIGAVTGGLLSSRVIKRTGETTAIAMALLIFALGLAMCAASPWLWGAFAGIVVLGFALPLFIVAFSTLLQRRTPNRLMGRVSTASDVVLGTPQALSIAVGAFLVGVISYRAIYAICAVVIVFSAGYLLVALHRVDGPIDPDSEDAEAPNVVEAARLASVSPSSRPGN